jgi:hypothetical protein
VSVEQDPHRLVFRAGPGEWYNQPHNQRWDMGEDAADIPPAAWHLALRATLAQEDPLPTLLVVDVREMPWLVGQDWGFVWHLAAELARGGCRLRVVASEHVVKAGNAIGMGDRFELATTLES